MKKTSKSRGVALNKCFSITKSLFNCKTGRSNSNVNYEYFSYEPKVNEITQPISSTIIDHSSSSENFSSQRFMFKSIQDISKINSNYNNYEQLSNESDSNECDDTELTRRSSFETFISAQPPRQKYEEITIIKQNVSPVSNLKTFQSQSPLNSLTECLHSTGNNDNSFSPRNYFLSGSNDDLSNLMPHVKRMNNFASTMKESQIESPIDSPSNLLNDFKNTRGQDSGLVYRLTEIESILNKFSMTCSDETFNGYESFVCASDYEATFVDDLNVHFAETVRILRDDNQEWLYVELIETGKRGYVPREIVVDFKQFIHQLKHQKSVLTSSRASIVDKPICV